MYNLLLVIASDGDPVVICRSESVERMWSFLELKRNPWLSYRKNER